MSQMTIGEVASKADVEASTLRYYESIGLLEPPARVGGQRRYSMEVLDRLQIIRVAKEAGFTLSEIASLMDGISDDQPPSATWKKMARDKIVDVEASIRQVEGMKALLKEGLECDCLSLDTCVVMLER